MQIDMGHLPSPERMEPVARAGLASLKRIALSDGPVTDRAKSMMTAVRDQLLHVDVDLEALEPLSAEGLAAAVPEREWRERILRGIHLPSQLWNNCSGKRRKPNGRTLRSNASRRTA